MRILTPWRLAEAADMVFHPYLPEFPFEGKKSGVLLCYLVQLKRALSQLDRNGRYVVVCRDGMQSLTEEMVEGNKFVKYWFSTNCSIEHERAEGIPSGLFLGGKKQTDSAEYLINKIKGESITARNSVMIGYRDITTDRKEASDALVGKPFSVRYPNISQREYYRAMRTHRFIASPWGAEPDCNRTWEALYLGVYPIVKKCQVYHYFTDMPIAFCDEWAEIDEAWLERKARVCAEKSLETMDADYWIRRIRERAEEVLR